MGIDIIGRPIPARVVVFSVAALAVPAIGGLQFPERLGDYGALLWLIALLPAFTMAYYRAWRGIATALAAGMATLAVTQAAAFMLGRQVPDMLLGVLIWYVAISLCIGWLAESFHKERAVVEDMAFTDLLTQLPNRFHGRLCLEKLFGEGGLLRPPGDRRPLAGVRRHHHRLEAARGSWHRTHLPRKAALTPDSDPDDHWPAPIPGSRLEL